MGSGNRCGRVASLLVCVVILAGCGSDDDRTDSRWLDWVQGRSPTTGSDVPNDPEPEPEPDPEPEPQNTPPTLSGTPATSVVAGSAYSFAPKANDADGDMLVFQIDNLPGWATFDASTGKLSGTPEDGDVGTYTNIVISVSDGEATEQLQAFSISVEAIGNGTATVTWTAPTRRTDGSPLTDLAGYKVYWGQESENYTESIEIDNPGVTTYVIEDLGRGTHYFAMTAISEDGLESAYSNEASKTIE